MARYTEEEIESKIRDAMKKSGQCGIRFSDERNRKINGKTRTVVRVTVTFSDNILHNHLLPNEWDIKGIGSSWVGIYVPV